MANFRTILTTYGLARVAAAISSGVPINLTKMAVGDGAGVAVDPSESQTALVNERARFSINTVVPDSSNPNQFYVEIVIPPETGGWTIREIGIYDDQGQLFAVGSFPATYKTVPSDGAVNDLIVRTEIVVSNASVITVILDPAVAIATQAWVISNINAGSILPGGTTAQVLRKKSNIDGDVEWASPDETNIFVDMIEDKGTLAEDQQTITLINCTTRGLSVFVGGSKIAKGSGEYEWQPDVSDPVTKIVLGRKYPAGTGYIASQNEPTGSVPTPLERSQNLADLPDKALSRTNLGVYSKAESDEKAPASLIGYFPRATAPAGWLKANGAAISRTTYAALFAAIGTTFGAGDGSTTFNLPDLRGEFIRGLDDGRGVDPGRTLGSGQAGQNASHLHTGTTNWGGEHFHGNLPEAGFDVSGPGSGGGVRVDFGDNVPYEGQIRNMTAGGHQHGFTTSSSGGNEARPRNVALLACIKY